MYPCSMSWGVWRRIQEVAFRQNWRFIMYSSQNKFIWRRNTKYLLIMETKYFMFSFQCFRKLIHIYVECSWPNFPLLTALFKRNQLFKDVTFEVWAAKTNKVLFSHYLRSLFRDNHIWHWQTAFFHKVKAPFNHLLLLEMMYLACLNSLCYSLWKVTS